MGVITKVLKRWNRFGGEGEKIKGKEGGLLPKVAAAGLEASLQGRDLLPVFREHWGERSG